MYPSELYAPTVKKARIEIIPLIDVIFFLLATFVLFTLSLEKILSLESPFPHPHREPSGDSVLFLQAAEGGTYFWKEGASGQPEPVTLSDLPPRLADYKSRVPAPRVMVRGDRTAKFGAAVQALDLVRAAGIHEACLETLVSPTGQ